MSYINKFKKYILISVLSCIGISNVNSQQNQIVSEDLLNKETIKKVSFKENAPNELKPWIEWVEKQNPQLNCPQIPKNEIKAKNICTFISQIEINTNKDYYEIKLFGYSYVNGYVGLPQAKNIKGKTIWPNSILINNKEGIINESEEQYTVEVEKGSFNISYKLENNNLNKIDFLLLSNDVVVFNDNNNSFKKEGRVVKNKEFLPNENIEKVNIDEKLKENKNLLDIKVWRNLQFQDEIMLNTKINLVYAGDIKEINLGRVLPEGFNFLKAESNLKIEKKNENFYVTVVPGEYNIDIEAYKLPIYKINEDQKIKIKDLINDFKKTEIWTIIQQDNYATLNISNEIIDASINNIPVQWKNLTAYNVKDELKYKINSRGISQEKSIKLKSQRKSWIGFNNNISDISIYHYENISVENKSANFLEFNKNIQAQSVQLNNNFIPIVKNKDKIGLVIPQDNTQLDLSFITEGANVPLYSLNADLNLISWEVMLAPRMRLLGVSGNVETTNTWLDSWNLYKVFLVFLISMIFYKMFGKRAGIFSLIGLIIFNEINNLSYLFVINILLVISLLKVLPKDNLSKLRKIILTYGLISFIYFSIQVFNYTREEVQLIMNPSLERISLNLSENNSNTYKERQLKKQEMNVSKVLRAPSSAVETMSDSTASSISENVLPQMGSGVMVEKPITQKEVDESLLGKKIQLGKPNPSWYTFPGSNNNYQIRVIGSISEKMTVRLFLADIMMVNIMAIIQIISLLIALSLYSLGLVYFYKKQIIIDYLPLNIKKFLNIER